MSPYSLQGEAVFAAGSFWQAEDIFSRIHGVVSTDVGYAGGHGSHPTFHELTDHVEAIRIYYDERAISYEELLDRFWALHDATADMPDRYGSRIFYISDDQRRSAKKSKEHQQNLSDEQLVTSIEPLGRFWPAEDYHQHYLAKMRGEL